MGKFSFSRVKVFVVVVYESIDLEAEERKNFWNEVDKAVDRLRNG